MKTDPIDNEVVDFSEMPRSIDDIKRYFIR